MINGFEEITYELTQKEKELLSGFVNSFKKKIGKENAIKSAEIVAIYQQMNIPMSGARVRKMVNYIRRNRLVINLIATSKGYYIENDSKKLDEYIESLRQRSREIIRIADSY